MSESEIQELIEKIERNISPLFNDDYLEEYTARECRHEAIERALEQVRLSVMKLAGMHRTESIKLLVDDKYHLVERLATRFPSNSWLCFQTLTCMAFNADIALNLVSTPSYNFLSRLDGYLHDPIPYRVAETMISLQVLASVHHTPYIKEVLIRDFHLIEKMIPFITAPEGSASSQLRAIIVLNNLAKSASPAIHHILLNSGVGNLILKNFDDTSNIFGDGRIFWQNISFSCPIDDQICNALVEEYAIPQRCERFLAQPDRDDDIPCIVILANLSSRGTYTINPRGIHQIIRIATHVLISQNPNGSKLESVDIMQNRIRDGVAPRDCRFVLTPLEVLSQTQQYLTLLASSQPLREALFFALRLRQMDIRNLLRIIKVLDRCMRVPDCESLGWTTKGSTKNEENLRQIESAKSAFDYFQLCISNGKSNKRVSALPPAIVGIIGVYLLISSVSSSRQN